MKTIFKHLAWVAIFIPILAATANYRSETVSPGSPLAKELNFDLTFQDQVENFRQAGIDTTNVTSLKNRPTTYIVTFNIVSSEKLKILFELTLTFGKQLGNVLTVPVETKSKFNKKADLVSTSFILQKDLLKNAYLHLRCSEGGSAEIDYIIPLNDYLEHNKP